MTGYRIDREMQQLGTSVCGWRMVLGLTAEQVSERAGISRDTLRKVENGNPTLSVGATLQVLRAIGTL